MILTSLCTQLSLQNIIRYFICKLKIMRTNHRVISVSESARKLSSSIHVEEDTNCSSGQINVSHANNR